MSLLITPPEGSPQVNYGKYEIYTRLDYNILGQLAGMTETTQPANMRTSMTGLATFHYDGSGNISSITRSLDDPTKPAGNLAKSETFTFEYGPDKLLTKASSVANDGTTSQYVYHYTEGNVTQLDYTQPDGSTHSETFTFDDKPNPYRGMLLLRWGLYDLINTLNKNNYNTVPSSYILRYTDTGYNSFLLNNRSWGGVDESYQYGSYTNGM